MKCRTLALLLPLLLVSTISMSQKPGQNEISLADSGDVYLNAVVNEVGKRAFAKHNITFSTTTYPSERALITANSGQEDGDAYRVYDLHKKSNGKYPNLVRVDVPYLSVYFTAFIKNEKIEIADWKDLANHRVAVIRGNKTMEVRINDYVPKKNQSFVTTYEQAFGMLIHDRVDVVIGKPIVGASYLKKHKHLRTSGKFQVQDIYIYLHKKHKKLIPKIELELQEMKDSGELLKIEKMVRERIVNTLEQ